MSKESNKYVIVLYIHSKDMFRKQSNDFEVPSDIVRMCPEVRRIPVFWICIIILFLFVSLLIV